MLVPGCSNNLGFPSTLVGKDCCWIIFYHLTLAWYWGKRNEKDYWNCWRTPRKRIWDSNEIRLHFLLLQVIWFLYFFIVWKSVIIFLFLLSFSHCSISKVEDVFKVITLPNRNWPQDLERGSRSPSSLLTCVLGVSVLLWNSVVYQTKVSLQFWFIW